MGVVDGGGCSFLIDSLESVKSRDHLNATRNATGRQESAHLFFLPWNIQGVSRVETERLGEKTWRVSLKSYAIRTLVTRTSSSRNNFERGTPPCAIELF